MKNFVFGMAAILLAMAGFQSLAEKFDATAKGAIEAPRNVASNGGGLGPAGATMKTEKQS